MRVLYGLDALPRGMALDDPRLPAVALGAEKLRLNTCPMPASLLAEAGNSHASRVAACTAWLQSLAGPWAASNRRRIADYMDAIAAEIARHRADIEHRLARYDGLYGAEDYVWSALRPLPRAWLIEPGAAPVFTELGFWDGRSLHSMPTAPGDFWSDETLPISPFRRPQP